MPIGFFMPHPSHFVHAFPEVLARTPTNSLSGTQHAISLGSPSAGELLLALFACTFNPTVAVGAGSGWSAVTQVSQSNNLTAAWVWKIAAGGDALRLDTSGSINACAIAYRIRDGISVDGTSYTSGAAANWNAPSHTPNGGEQRYAWLPFFAVNATLTSPPANYASGGSASGSGIAAYTVERLLQAVSEDPGAAIASVANQAGFTLAVQPYRTW
jgi:hypothetical protein